MYSQLGACFVWLLSCVCLPYDLSFQRKYIAIRWKAHFIKMEKCLPNYLEYSQTGDHISFTASGICHNAVAIFDRCLHMLPVHLFFGTTLCVFVDCFQRNCFVFICITYFLKL